MPLPMEDNPRAVFERLFGASDTTDPDSRLSRNQKNAPSSTGDWDRMTIQTEAVEPTIAPGWTRTPGTVRDVERRITRA